MQIQSDAFPVRIFHPFRAITMPARSGKVIRAKAPMLPLCHRFFQDAGQFPPPLQQDQLGPCENRLKVVRSDR